jgi:hypothetical protein
LGDILPSLLERDPDEYETVINTLFSCVGKLNIPEKEKIARVFHNRAGEMLFEVGHIAKIQKILLGALDQAGISDAAQFALFAKRDENGTSTFSKLSYSEFDMMLKHLDRLNVAPDKKIALLFEKNSSNNSLFKYLISSNQVEEVRVK